MPVVIDIASETTPDPAPTPDPVPPTTPPVVVTPPAPVPPSTPVIPTLASLLAMPRYPNVEFAVIDLLAPFVVGSVSTPENLQDVLPFTRVRRSGGSDTGVTDQAIVSVELYTSSYAEGEPLIEGIRQFLTHNKGRHRVVDEAGSTTCIDSITTASGPREVPYPDLSVRRFEATFVVHTRRH